jgi:carbamoyltransferase
MKILKKQNKENFHVSADMNILSINFNHDGSGVILSNGIIKGYVNTERFSRLKKHPGLREEDLVNILEQAKLKIEDIDLVLILNLNCMDSPEIPARYGTNLKETWFKFSINATNKKITIFKREIDCIVNLDHFLCHSALAYYFSPFDSAICLAYDPCGSGVYIGKDNKLEKISFPETPIGNIYDSISRHLGLGGVFGAGKTMGLAPYGEVKNINLENEFRLFASRRITTETLKKIVEKIIKRSERYPKYVKEQNNKWNATTAYHIQRLLEIILSDIMEWLYRICILKGIEPNICLSGGTALNSVANQICFKRSKFLNLYLHPACGDDGTAIGAALFFWHHVLGNPKIKRTNKEAMYSIRTYDNKIETTLEKYHSKIKIENHKDYIKKTAKLLSEGKIIGWFHGASEIGPRALGNRSILCDARDPDMKEKLNSHVKFREMFRPFAPSVLNESSEEWFGLKDSPFMLRVADVLKNNVPAITHVDNTARIQTIAREDNPEYYELIDEFCKITRVPLVLNTSFNTKGEPIVETPEDAINTLLASEMDYVVFPGFIISKKQPKK